MNRRVSPVSTEFRPWGGKRGFAVVATLTVMVLLSLLAIAFLSLATVTVKTSSQDRAEEEARANARMAMMLAMGQLQREMGPDQRVSAQADLLSEKEGFVANPHWTGVWKTIQRDGNPVVIRDDETGGLIDTRDSRTSPAQTRVTYLVSGNESGLGGQEGLNYEAKDPIVGEQVQLVGMGSAGAEKRSYVSVPKVGLFEGTQKRGGYGYWIGDLGVRANLRSLNPYRESQGLEKNLPFLSGMNSSIEVMEGLSGASLELNEETKRLLMSDRSLDMVGANGAQWRKDHFHAATIYSQGVLADVRDGGLKGNLSSFLNQDQDVEPLKIAGKEEIPGLSASGNLVGYANKDDARRRRGSWELSRFRKTSPKFGLLRDWARLGEEIDIDALPVAARTPKSEPDFSTPDALVGSSQNLNPATLSSFDHAGVSPVLVEGSMFVTYSIHLNPPGSPFKYNIRSHTFPRVVLWNPYNVALSLDESMAMIQVNGRRGFRTDAWTRTGAGREIFLGYASWLSWGGRNPLVEGEITKSSSYNDAYTGSYYFKLSETTIKPGECLVFLPDHAAEYDGENLANNTLSPSAGYDPALNYYQSASEYGGGMNWYPKFFWYAPSDAWFGDEGQTVQGDDSQMILKTLGDSPEVSPEDFDVLEQVAAVSCSLQYGAGKEPSEAWYHDRGAPGSGVRMEFLELANPQITLPPDRRTRQGYRMRWFREHDSHLAIFGNPLRDQPEFWDESPIGSWNVRAAYAARSPFDNLAGNVGDSSSSGPWFFGLYSKDLYDEAVGWEDQTPVRRNGENHGNPFGLPNEGADKYILFDVPRKGLGVISLAQFQHAKLSECVWHPSYAVGNSLVDPRLGLDGMESTVPKLTSEERDVGGFAKDAIGWSENKERGQSKEAWAEFGRGFFLDMPEEDYLVYDLSYELNHTLWDRYFLSSGSERELRRFAENPQKDPLPNARMRALTGADGDDLVDFHRAAKSLLLDGAFNVNSTNVEAWKAVLSANRGEDGLTPFPRVLGGNLEEFQGNDSDEESVWSGRRLLGDVEIASLAEAIVQEVKERGPFLSMSDFVNRRLQSGDHGKSGVLESAINNAGINGQLDSSSSFAIENETSLVDYDHPDHIEDSTRMEQTLKPQSKAWGAAGYLTQADLLQAIGGSLSVRSDTFVIRTYGESISGNGKVQARAWCEAVVQRVPDPVRPDASGLNPEHETGMPNFGRRFVVQSFRWLSPHEI
ncbi:type II secretion system GspH family protein [Akkermansiaceae bacterium]|nr:type II secretion system GspH family protein [Akkermansiaceae bacterium]